MKTTLAPCVAVIVLLSVSLSAQANYKNLYITPTEEGFEVYVAAAIAKKGVHLDVVTDIEMADFVMKAAPIETKKVSTGAKWANCLFAYCAGNEDKGSVSVQVVDREGVVKWSYAVNKGRGEKNKQSLAEAIAKHLKDEFLHQK